jgi:TonB-dependent receptor
MFVNIRSLTLWHFVIQLLLTLMLPVLAFAEDYGDLAVLVFKDGQPYRGARVVVIDQQTSLLKRALANTEGEAVLELKSGDYRVRIETGGVEANVVVVTEEETQVIFHIFSQDDGEVSFLKPEVQQPDPGLEKINGVNEGPVVPIAGLLLDEETGKPVYNARVFIQGRPGAITSNPQGQVKAKLPPGKHTLSVVHKKYTTKVIKNVEIKSGQQQVVQLPVVQLSPAGLQLDDFIVLAPQIGGSIAALIEVRKKSASVADVIGAEQMAKSGDSDAAASLRRVTGLTLVGGKYVYVRGLGERYSNTLMNGFSMPSPDLSRRVVPMDMFPTEVLEGMVIQKSYSPDRPAEFGGGVIQMKTRSLPEKPFVKIGTSYKYQAGVNGNLLRTYKRGSTDWAGVDDGTRRLPKFVKDSTSDRALTEKNDFNPEGFTPSELQRIGREFSNTYDVDEEVDQIPPNMNVSGGFRAGSRTLKVGGSASFLYGSDYSFDQKLRQTFALGNSGLERTSVKDVNILENDIKVGSTVDLGAKIGKRHNFKLSGMLLRKTTDTVQESKGVNKEGEPIRETRLQWVERQIWSRQFKADHRFLGSKGPLLEWRVAKTEATRYEPDRREYRYEDADEDGFYVFSLREDGNQRIYSDLIDEATDVGFDLTFPLKVNKNIELEPKIGAKRLNKKRNSDTRRFTFSDRRSTETREAQASRMRESLEAILSSDNIGADGFLPKEGTLPTDNYEAGQTVNAFYAMTEAKLFKRVRFLTGLRFEESSQRVRTFNPFDRLAEPEVAELETVNRLPVYSLTYQWSPKVQIRAAYSETLSRPDFRELSASPYTDPVSGNVYVGNPLLETTVIKNSDLRWEWYPSAKESVSLAAFHKEFDQPIETIIESGTEERRTYANALSANNYGLEIDARKNLSFVGKWARHLYLAGNYTWIDSEIQLAEESKGVLTSSQRPLQGQSPYITNIHLEFDHPKGTNVGLLYNVFGERIVDVGVQGIPDVIEKPFEQLDLVLSQKLNNRFKVSAKVKNILDGTAERTQGGEVVESYKKGQVFSMSVSASL